MLTLLLLVIVFAQRTLINHEGFPRTSMDPLSVILSTVGLVPLLYGLSSFASSDNAALCVGMMVVGLVLVGLFVYAHKMRTPSPGKAHLSAATGALAKPAAPAAAESADADAPADAAAGAEAAE